MGASCWANSYCLEKGHDHFWASDRINIRAIGHWANDQIMEVYVGSAWAK